MRRVVLGTLLAIMIATVAAAAGVAYSERVFIWLVDQLAQRTGGQFSVAAASGRLAGPWRLEGVAYETESGRYRLRALDCDWRLRELWRARFAVTYCRGQRLAVELATGPKSDQPPQMPSITLPVTVVVGRVEVASLSITTGDAAPVVIDRAVLGGRAQHDVVDVRDLTLSAADYSVSLRGTIGLRTPHALAAEASWSFSGDLQTTIDGATTVRGDLAKLDLTTRITGGAELEQSLVLHNVLIDPTWSGSVRIHRFDARALHDAWPRTALSGRLDAQGHRSGGRATGALRGRFEDYPELEVEFAARSDGAEVQVERAQMSVPGSEAQLDVSGSVNLAATARELDIAGRWRGLTWPLTDAARWTSAAGGFRVRGNDEELRVTVADAELGAPGDSRRTAALHGQLAVFDLRGAPRVHGDVRIPVLEWGDLSGTGIMATFDIDTAQRRSSTVRVEVDELASGDRPPVTEIRTAWSGELDTHRLRTTARIGETARVTVSIEGGYQHGTWAGELLEAGLEGWGASHWRLVEPAGLRIAAAGAELASLCIAEQTGRLCMRGTWQPGEWQAAAELQALPWGELARLAHPDVHGGGRLSGTVHVAADPQHALRAEGALTLTAGHVAFVPVTGVEGWEHGGGEASFDVDTEGGAAALALKLPAGAEFASQLALRGPLTGDPGRQTVEGTATLVVPALERMPHWWPEGYDLKGGVQASVNLVGTRAQPELSIDAQLDAGRLQTETLMWNGTLGVTGSVYRDTGGWSGTVHLNAPEGRLRSPKANAQEDLGYRNIEIDAELADQALNARIEGRVAGDGVLDGELRITALRQSASQSSLAGRIAVHLPNLRRFDALLPQLGTEAGTLDVQIDVAGTRAHPALTGGARLSQGQFSLPGLGITLADVEGSIEGGRGDRFAVALSAKSGEGRVEARGDVIFSGDAAWHADIAVTGRRFTVVDRLEAFIRANPDLRLALSPAEVSISGTVHVPEADIRPATQRASGVVVSRDVVFVEPDTDAPPPAPMAVSAAVDVRLGDEIRFDGYGLSGRLNGELKVVDEPGKVTTATGELEIVAGQYTVYGQTLSIQTGRLVFAGGPIDNPGLDARAERAVGDVTAGVRMRGTAADPELILYSDPDMPDAEKLSYLILGRSTDSASGAEGAILFRAATTLLPGGGGGVQDTLRNTFGLDELSLQPATSDETGEGSSIVLGKYLAPKLYVSYAAGLAEAINVFRIRYELSRKWTIQTESSERESGGDLFYTIER